MTRCYALSPTIRCLVVSAFLLVACHSLLITAFAQSASATLSGTVEDTNGAVIPGVSITVTNTATGAQRQTTTNAEGYFVVPLLPPSRYQITAQNQGFTTVRIPEVVLNVGDQKALQIQLKAGDINATVQVINDAPLINESPAVGTVIDRQFVQNLPLNGRSFNTLLQLTPGVVIAYSNNTSPGQFSVAGQRTDANNFLVDGVSANFGVSPTLGVVGGVGQSQAFSALGGTSSLVSVDALQEFRAETSSFTPEFGRTPGGQILLTTRSGTNSFHGGIFDYFRNDALDANDWFANAAGTARAPERHNDFGAFLGGPLYLPRFGEGGPTLQSGKNRTFFFFSLEGARLRQPQTLVRRVPSLAARSSASPLVAPFLNAFPLPNGPTSGTTAQFTGSFSDKATLNATSLRIDHNFSDRFSLFGRYNEAPSETVSRDGSASSELDTTVVNTRTLTVGMNMSLSSRTSNSLRGSYSTQKAGLSFVLDSFGGAVPPDSRLLIGSLPVSQNFGVVLMAGVGRYSLGIDAKNKTTQIVLADDMVIVRGAHQLKFGGDFRAIYLNTNPAQHELFYIATIARLLATGKANQVISQSFTPAQVLAPSLSIYGQDIWKVGQKLVLTYGARWELNPAPSARGATILAAWTNVNSPATLAPAPLGTPVWKTTYGNFAPRVGVAYKLRGDLVLRAGWGMFYDLGVGDLGKLVGFYPNSASATFFGVSLPIADVTPFLVTPPRSLQPPFTSPVYAFSPDLKLPVSYQWNLAIEKSFGSMQAVSATYVGQAGRRLLRQDAINQPNANFTSFFDLTGNTASSSYHALQVQYRRPLATRLQALMNYTWSHSIDNASDDTVETISNTVFPANDRASSSFDVRHSFSAALTYELPSVAKSGALAALTRHWSIQSIIVARSGFPFNASSSNVFSPVQGTNIRPDIVAGQPYWIQDSTAPGGRQINPAAFTDPPTDPNTGVPTRQGTEGRNDIRGFGFHQIDFSLSRKFPITERVSLQLRADAFNLFNHPNFTDPSPLFNLSSPSMLNQGLQGLSPLFQEGGPRSLQLSFKLVF